MQLPFNLFQWIEKNGEQLKPPVGNKVLLENDDMLVMMVGGPNQRTDYHYNETPEFFYQIKGYAYLNIQTEKGREKIELKEGQVFLLPAKVPHSPQRSAGSVGMVIELKKNRNKDGLLWYCSSCNNKLYEEYFKIKNIEKDFPPVFKRFYENRRIHTCEKCGCKNDFNQ